MADTKLSGLTALTGANVAPLTDLVYIDDISVTTSKKITVEELGIAINRNPNATSQALSDGASVDWDTDLGTVATWTIAGNRTMNAPTNLNVGTLILVITQDGTGSRTVTWNGVFKWDAGTAPVLSTAASAVDVLSFFCDGTNLYGGLFVRGAA